MMSVKIADRTFKDFGTHKASDEFIDAFAHSGGRWILCEACGREHMSTDPMFSFNRGEKAWFSKRNEKNPDGFIYHDGSVHWGDIFRKQVVVDCPCGYVGYIERVIWSQRFIFTEYYAKRAERESNDAIQMAQNAERAKSAVDKALKSGGSK